MEKTKVKKSQIQEKNVSEYLGMKLTPRSGGTIYKKGDVTDATFLLDCKTVMSPKESYSIKKEVLEKADKERFEDRKQYYGIVFDFGNPKNIGKDTFVVVPLETFKALYDAYRKGNEDEFTI